MDKRIHGGDVYAYDKKMTDFSANINPLGMPQKAVERVWSNMENWHLYPDRYCRKLVRAISGFEKVDENKIVCGNGAADLIYRLAVLFKPEKALVLAPTFGEYECALEQVGCHVVYYGLKEQEGFHAGEDILNHIPEMDMVFLCNPNNPTGNLMEMDLLEVVLKTCRANGCILVVDECFLGFVEKPQDYSMVPFTEEYNNLVVLKGFTKLFAMAGLRLGYTVSGKTLAQQLQETGQVWPVSLPAQEAGIGALEDRDYLPATARWIEKEREFLIGRLKELSFHVFGSKANYIFFYSGHNNLARLMAGEGILIRDCSSYRGLRKGYYRVAVKNREDNLLLIKALKTVCVQ